MDEHWAQNMIETAPYAVVTMDAEGVITGWNSQAETIFGWFTEEVLGRRMTETILAQRHREFFDRSLRLFVEKGEGQFWNQRGEIVALYRDGREFPAEDNGCLTGKIFGRLEFQSISARYFGAQAEGRSAGAE